ncbi:unnamed protein product [Rotaria sp. Silwood2]|nr:unnamed protein product [Rotaria sp. Silwood2]
MIRSVWAIWKHKASSNDDPHHEWCSIKYCGYLKSLEKGEEYDHNKHRLPLGIMKAIRPVFDELAHPDTLKKVINGGSQNSNESSHAVLWSLAPKNRYATGVVIDLCAAIAVLSYNDTTTNNDTDSSDESDDSNNIDSNKSIQENVNKGRNDDGVAYVSLLCQFFL